MNNGDIIIRVIVLIFMLYLVYRYMLIRFLKELKLIKYLKINGVFTTGKIVGAREVFDSDKARAYIEIIEFQDKENNKVSFESKILKYTNKDIGKVVELYYEEKNSTNCMVNINERYAKVLFGIIFVLFVFGVLVLIFLRVIS